MGDYYSFSPTKNTNALWRYFMPVIGNAFGTAGLIAGLYLRSGCDPYTGYENYIGEDTLALNKFAHDRRGFGIGKWKNWTRKQSLYNFCKKAGTAIYELSTQADFVMDEFSGTTYGPVLKELKEVTSVREAAYLVYDKYLDIKKKNDDKRETCATIAMDVLKTYGEENKLMVPVKYVKADKKGVVVRGKRGKIIPFVRQRMGTMNPEALYQYVTLSDTGNEYAIYFKDAIGYVNTNKVQVVIKLEAIK